MQKLALHCSPHCASFCLFRLFQDAHKRISKANVEEPSGFAGCKRERAIYVKTRSARSYRVSKLQCATPVPTQVCPCAHAHMHTCTHAHTPACPHARRHACIMHACIHPYINLDLHVPCAHAPTHPRTHAPTHARTHTRTQKKHDTIRNKLSSYVRESAAQERSHQQKYLA